MREIELKVTHIQTDKLDTTAGFLLSTCAGCEHALPAAAEQQSFDSINPNAVLRDLDLFIHFQ